MFEIIKTLQEGDRDCDFVALGFLENEGNNHATLIIKYNSELYQYHYTSREIDFSNVSYDFFHKITETIQTSLVPAFYAHCREILKRANPQYGYFYSGEFYDRNGIHFSDKAVGERMTCVGFCLNVLKGFLEEDYIYYLDWDENSHDSPDYLVKYANNHNLKIEDISLSHRRITPLELLTSAFFVDTPIKKTKIDSKKEEVKDYIYSNM